MEHPEIVIIGAAIIDVLAYLSAQQYLRQDLIRLKIFI